MDNVIKFIENLDIKNKSVVIGVSGGPDSMLLLDTLLTLKEKLNIKIIVAHVHHNLRKESDQEAIMVEEYCKKNNVIFEFKKIEEYPDNKFSEDKARQIRYEFFDELVKKYNSDILFTAHHGDDLIETVLMRITRGSTLRGYAGIKAISHDRGYIIARPLIYLNKDEILNLLNQKHIKYVEDMSNKDNNYTRNRYRNNILPLLKQENENINIKFLDYSNKLLLADSYLSKERDKFEIIDNKINIKKFNKLDQIIKIYVLEKYLNIIYLDKINKLNDKHIELIINYLQTSNNLVFDLPENKKGIIEYNEFKIIDNIETKDYEYTFIDKIDLPNGKQIIQNNNSTRTNNFVIHLNSKDIKLPFHVRNRKDNDKMIVKNMTGHKKINDIFTDCKIEKSIRDTYPIVLDDTGEIIWIPGVKKSHLDRKKEQNYDIILEYN